MIKDYGSSEKQLLQENLRPVDWISGPWNSFDEFNENLNEFHMRIEDVPDGTKIRILSQNGLKEYYRLNNTWNEIKNNVSINGESVSDGYKITVNDKSITIPRATLTNSGVISPDVISALNRTSDVVQNNSSSIEILNDKINVQENIINGAVFTDSSSEEYASDVEDNVIKCANDAASYAAKASDEVIKAHSQIKAVYNILNSIEMSEDIDEGLLNAVAKNTGDIDAINTIIGNKVVEQTCEDGFTIIDSNLKSGVRYVCDCDKLHGLELTSMSEKNIHSDVKEKLFTQSDSERYIYFTPAQDVNYLRIYNYNQGVRNITIYPVGITQKVDEILESIDYIKSTKNLIDEISDNVGKNVINFAASGNNYVTKQCDIKKNNLYKITINKSGSVEFLTKTIASTVSSTSSYVIDKVNINGCKEIYFLASDNASYIQFWSLTYDQNVSISVGNIKDGNVFKGKKCVWIGTSIPANGVVTENYVAPYPILVGDILGMQVVNKSISSSNIAIKSDAASITSKAYMLCLSMTKAEMKSMWGTNADNTVLNCSFEEIFKAITPDTDIVIFDHGFNDRALCHNDVVKGYDNIDFTSKDKTTWHGAFKFLLDKIYYINPRIKVIIAGYFTNNHVVDSVIGNINTNDICIAQEYLAKAYNIQILRIWNVLGVNDNAVDVSNEFLSNYNTINGKTATNLTRFTLFCPDGVHPHTDKTGNSLRDYADSIVKCLNCN